MKIDRLLGIITTLLQRDKVTAPELALKFEVSRRTIQRDVEDICKAGIPIITYQGGDGGISIAEGYKLDKTVVSVEELNNIITGLKSINSVANTADIGRLITKLSPKQIPAGTGEKVLIDLASHYKSSLSNKLTLIKKAISENRLVSFEYYSEKGVSNRLVEPYIVTYRWSAWYVYGYCTERADFRLFKLNRLWKLKLLEEVFEVKEINPDDLKLDNFFQDDTFLTALFDKETEYLLVEEYGPDCFEVTDQGKLKVSVGFTNREYICRWLLSFGDKVEVIEPLDLRVEIVKTAKNLVKVYEHDI